MKFTKKFNLIFKSLVLFGLLSLTVMLTSCEDTQTTVTTVTITHNNEIIYEQTGKKSGSLAYFSEPLGTENKEVALIIRLKTQGGYEYYTKYYKTEEKDKVSIELKNFKQTPTSEKNAKISLTNKHTNEILFSETGQFIIKRIEKTNGMTNITITAYDDKRGLELSPLSTPKAVYESTYVTEDILYEFIPSYD